MPHHNSSNRSRLPGKQQTQNADALTPKEVAFVREYLKSGNKTEAYINAGFACARASASANAGRLIKKDRVQRALTVGAEVQQSQAIADATERRETLTVMLRDGEAHPIARLKAADILNKMDGLYITKLGDPNGKPLMPPGSVFSFVVTQIPGAENRT